MEPLHLNLFKASTEKQKEQGITVNKTQIESVTMINETTKKEDNNEGITEWLNRTNEFQEKERTQE